MTCENFAGSAISEAEPLRGHLCWEDCSGDTFWQGLEGFGMTCQVWHGWARSAVVWQGLAGSVGLGRVWHT